MNKATLAAEVARINWYHTIDLGSGIVTPGRDYDTRKKLARFQIPADLSGKSVLDIGAWDGFFSFEAARRGAKRVVAADSFAWRDGGQAGFHLAREALGLPVEDVNIEVLDLSPETVGSFDVVLFLGVLYHMAHPLLALERVFSVTSEQLILETHVDLLGCRRPAMAFYPGDVLNGDATNWWGPNAAAVIAMLRTVGFRRAELVRRYPPAFRHPRFSRHALAYRLLRAARARLKGEAFRPAFGRDAIPLVRMVFHAWR